MPSKTFYVKPYSNEILERLISFSRFLGEDEEGGKFEIDPERARLNGVTLEQIKKVLGSLGLSLTLKPSISWRPKWEVMTQFSS